MTQGSDTQKADKVCPVSLEACKFCAYTHIVHVLAGALISTSCCSFSVLQIKSYMGQKRQQATSVLQVVQECLGYRATSGHSRWCGLLLPIFAALAAVLTRVAPQLAAKLLAPCDLQRAEYVLVKVILSM